MSRKLFVTTCGTLACILKSTIHTKIAFMIFYRHSPFYYRDWERVVFCVNHAVRKKSRSQIFGFACITQRDFKKHQCVDNKRSCFENYLVKNLKFHE